MSSNVDVVNVSYDRIDQRSTMSKGNLKTQTPVRVRPASARADSMPRRVNQQNPVETKNFEKLYYELQERQAREDAEHQEAILQLHNAIDNYKMLLKQQSEHFTMEKKLWTDGTQANQVINHLIKDNKLKDAAIADMEQKYTREIASLRAKASQYKKSPSDADSSIMSDVKEL